MRVIITGGSGFVGTNLVDFFHSKGFEVVNFDILPPRNPEHMNLWKKVNICDRDSFLTESRSFKPDYFLHFAARTDLDEKDNLDGYASNIDGVINAAYVIKNTPSIQRVIFASSQLVCPIGYQPEDENDVAPTTLYGRSKVLTEKIIRAALGGEVVWTILRPTSLWGPWFGIPYRNFFEAIKKGWYINPKGIVIYKQWGFVLNSVFQVWKLLEARVEDIHSKTFYLADYQPVRLDEFANQVQKAFGTKPIRSLNYPILRNAAKAGDTLIKLGWKSPPLSSFRLKNIITSELQNLSPLESITGPVLFSTEEAIDITTRWMNSHPRNLSHA